MSEIYKKGDKIWAHLSTGVCKARFWGYVKTYNMYGDVATYSKTPLPYKDEVDVILWGGVPCIMSVHNITRRL